MCACARACAYVRLASAVCRVSVCHVCIYHVAYGKCACVPHAREHAPLRIWHVAFVHVPYAYVACGVCLPCVHVVCYMRHVYL
jgi:hypothetical protein